MAMNSILLQARFALTSSAVFSRTDTVTDSERFYQSILELFDDIDEQEELRDLLVWWNRYAFAFHRFGSLIDFSGQTDKYFLATLQRNGLSTKTVRWQR
jgi:hypothetical protein